MQFLCMTLHCSGTVHLYRSKVYVGVRDIGGKFDQVGLVSQLFFLMS